MKAPLLSGCPSSNSELGQIRVHVLYKWAEIPAKTVIPAIALSVTYRKQESPTNTGSTPVSATKTFKISALHVGVPRLESRTFLQNTGKSKSRLKMVCRMVLRTVVPKVRSLATRHLGTSTGMRSAGVDALIASRAGR
jgi:hypothetical protein